MCFHFYNVASDLQARSISADQHNDLLEFQFFAIDFDGAKTGLHGSEILAQAVFVNDAIRAIQHYYRMNSGKTQLINSVSLFFSYPMYDFILRF